MDNGSDAGMTLGARDVNHEVEVTDGVDIWTDRSRGHGDL